MIDLSVYNRKGQQIENLKVEESIFGVSIRYPLLKQAIVMYNANNRIGTASTRSRGMVSGSTTKLFRQKGTGRARIGNIRTGKRVGGGVTFAKVARDFRKSMPKKQKRLAKDSAILAKLLGNNIVVVDELNFEKPSTRDFAEILGNLKINRSCLVTTGLSDNNLYKSARNIPKVSVIPVQELNAGVICRHQKMLLTKEALVSLLNKSEDSEN